MVVVPLAFAVLAAGASAAATLDPGASARAGDVKVLEMNTLAKSDGDPLMPRYMSLSLDSPGSKEAEGKGTVPEALRYIDHTAPENIEIAGSHEIAGSQGQKGPWRGFLPVFYTHLTLSKEEAESRHRTSLTTYHDAFFEGGVMCDFNGEHEKNLSLPDKGRCMRYPAEGFDSTGDHCEAITIRKLWNADSVEEMWKKMNDMCVHAGAAGVLASGASLDLSADSSADHFVSVDLSQFRQKGATNFKKAAGMFYAPIVITPTSPGEEISRVKLIPLRTALMLEMRELYADKKLKLKKSSFLSDHWSPAVGRDGILEKIAGSVVVQLRKMEGLYHWESRKEKLVEYISSKQPDVVGLVEDDSRGDLGRALQEKNHDLVPTLTPHRDVSLSYNSKKFESCQFVASQEQSRRGVDGDKQAHYLIHRCRLASSTWDYLIAVVHLPSATNDKECGVEDYAEKCGRIVGLFEVHQAIAEHIQPSDTLLMMGDFNIDLASEHENQIWTRAVQYINDESRTTEMGRAELKFEFQNGWRSALATTAYLHNFGHFQKTLQLGNVAPAYHYWTSVTPTRREMLDYVWHLKDESEEESESSVVIDTKLLSCAPNQQVPSDHAAVVVQLRNRHS